MGPSKDRKGATSIRLFQKNLRDMITGIRSHKDKQKDFMNKCLQDIRAEVVSNDVRTKAVAIEKATYLHSLGFNMNWASFHVVELMSTPNVKYKRVGYLAATQSFGDDTDVVLLIPNLLKKDLASPNPAEAALAISCLGNIVTPELSQTLVADVYSLLNNHKPDLRRRACLCLYKCFLRYPEALRPSFARLTECLEDDDQTVVQAAVTVLSELAMHNPKTYLPLAPKFYKLLTTSSSNWMTIKLVKVFGALTPLEPRLGKKLVGPLSEILETTSAKSLLYECIRTVVMGMTTQEKVVRQAVDKLKDMLEDTDPNIKFLALDALTYLLESHPRVVAEHKGNIFGCLDHEDTNIQYCALKIVRGLVTKKTLMDTSAHLMGAMGKAAQRFRDELVWSVVHICQNDRYALVTDFVWYLSVLADLARVPSSAHGGLVGEQLVDICLRVEVVRESAVAILKPLLLDPALLEPTDSNATVPDALKAIAWIVGEYAHFIPDHREVIAALSHPGVANLPPHVQAVYVQALLKVYACAVAGHAGLIRPPPPAPPPSLAPFERAPDPELTAATTAVDVAVEEPDEKAAEAPAYASDSEADEDKKVSVVQEVKQEAEEAGDDAEMGSGEAKDGEREETEEEGREAEADEKPEPEALPRPEPLQELALAPAPAVPPMEPEPESEPEETHNAALVPMTPYLSGLAELILDNLSPFCVSLHLEVRERSCQLQTILGLVSAAEAETPGQGVAIMEQFAVVLAEEVQPVSAKAQRKVEPPAGLLLSAPLAKEWDSLLASSGDEESDDERDDVGGKARKKGKKGGKRDKSKDVTDLFTIKKSKEQIAKEEQEARDMLQKHREKMGNYYLGGEVTVPAGETAGGKTKKRGKKGQQVEAIAAPAPPEPVMTAYMKQSLTGGKMARPTIKGESDSSDDEQSSGGRTVGTARGRSAAGAGKVAYAPKNGATSLHAGLGHYDPLKPLGRGEVMPAVEAYPTFDPYANEGGGGGGNAFQAPAGGKGQRRQKHGGVAEDAPGRAEKRRAHEEKKKAQKAAKSAGASAEGGLGAEQLDKKHKSARKPKVEKSEKKESKGDKRTKKVSSKMAGVSIGDDV